MQLLILIIMMVLAFLGSRFDRENKDDLAFACYASSVLVAVAGLVFVF